ncbi:alpha/beta fold hydrolase [Paraglaciecola sp.]|uniref:alpha/beta hydrolase n=1 Tax=Paraglaciecola sp. TaxID=1920173 RepID=UPI0030F3B336
MKSSIFFFLVILTMLSNISCATSRFRTNDAQTKESYYQLYKLNSHINGLNLALHHHSSMHQMPKGTILLLHGSSFPSKLSFAFKMGGVSWIDQLTAAGFNVYSLDFLGYGGSDRYPEMIQKNKNANPLGRGAEVVTDVNIAVEYILAKEKMSQIDLLGHSWGGAVAAKFSEIHSQKVNSLVMYAGITSVIPAEVSMPIEIPAYSTMTSKERIKSLNSLAPESERPLLASELFKSWGDEWLRSDPIISDDLTIDFPAGPKADVHDFFNGQSFYDPNNIESKVLIIRGEYDQYPSDKLALQLYNNLVNAKLKRYVEIKEGTHVLHLEKNRHKLYESVIEFLIMPTQ